MHKISYDYFYLQILMNAALMLQNVIKNALIRLEVLNVIVQEDISLNLQSTAVLIVSMK